MFCAIIQDAGATAASLGRLLRPAELRARVNAADRHDFMNVIKKGFP